jgi:UDP-N-acetylglucosamine 4,6-dehydratase/5-epimerase
MTTSSGGADEGIFDGKAVLVTGGTGSFGRAFVQHLLTRHRPRKVVVFSRDEFKQHDLSLRFPDGPYPVRYFLGDVRDPDRLRLAFRDVDFVVHAAALKQVPAAEYNPFEFVKTNIYGTQNVAMAALESPRVEKVVALSTDKACNPLNLYGSTKLAAEKIIAHANAYDRDRMFAAVRYGNVAGSRGSVIPLFKAKLAMGEPLTVTDTDMTRFAITMAQAIELVELAFSVATGGEILVPKLPSMRIMDLVAALNPIEWRLTGRRPGEKVHEFMIGPDEPAYDDAGYYRLAPGGATGFTYSSGTNPDVMTVEQIRALCDSL